MGIMGMYAYYVSAISYFCTFYFTCLFILICACMNLITVDKNFLTTFNSYMLLINNSSKNLISKIQYIVVLQIIGILH